MDKVDKKQVVTSKVYSIEKINPFFSKVKIFVMYDGLNRNGSYLSRDSINNALQTIYNIPIVGEFLVDEQNFGGHGANVVKNSDGQYDLILSTRPYGVVPESAKIYWESVTEEDGTEREYLVVDGAYLWTGRYPELQTILDEGYYGQSMEIEIINGNYSLVDGQQVLNIQDFIFTAFCLLGIDKDSDMFGQVPPAFESGRVVAYSLDKDSFTSHFNQMIDELKFTLKEGGNNQMENTNATTNAQEDLKNRLAVGSSEPVVEPVGALAVEPETTVTEPTQVEPQEPATVVEPVVEPTATEPDTATLDSSQTATEGAQADGGEGAVAPDGGATFTVTEEEHSTLKANFEALESQVKELEAYKRNRELGDLQGRFSAQVSEQELKELFESNPDATIEKLEVEIFALIGKKNYSLESKTNQNKIAVVSPKATTEKSNSPYGDIQFIN